MRPVTDEEILMALAGNEEAAIVAHVWRTGATYHDATEAMRLALVEVYEGRRDPAQREVGA